MRTLLIKTDGDLDFDIHRSLRMVDGDDERQQSLRVLTSTFAGEWFLDTLHGIDFWSIIGRKLTPELIMDIRSVCETGLRRDPRITDVVSIDIETDEKTRTLGIRVVVRMDNEYIEGSMEVSV